MTKIEEVALAIEAAAGKAAMDENEYCSPTMAEAAARAAIAAMREPSAAMYAALPATWNDIQFSVIYNRVIDAALAEHP